MSSGLGQNLFEGSCSKQTSSSPGMNMALRMPLIGLITASLTSPSPVRTIMPSICVAMIEKTSPPCAHEEQK